MEFTIAVGFDQERSDEVFRTVRFGEQAIRQIVQKVLDNLDYKQRTQLVADYAGVYPPEDL